MGERTGIEWADATWNAWQGCTKVSPGCAHCYAEWHIEHRFKRRFETVRRSAPATFNLPLMLARNTVAPVSGPPFKIFVCSLSDFFHPAADEWRREAWLIIKQTPQFVYQILTKRPERIEACLPTDWGPKGWPNVWLGTSVESQEYVHRAFTLGKIQAAQRFLSCEPLLGPLDLGPVFRFKFDPITWVIVGGESGPHARKMDPDWVRSIRDQCDYYGIPLFFKQWGGPAGAKRDHGDAVLDGKLHKDFPMEYEEITTTADWRARHRKVEL